MTTITQGHSAEAFIADLRHWREVRGLSQKRLAAEMGYDASYISKIESGHQKPTRDFAVRADDVLHTAGVLAHRWREYSASTAENGRTDVRRDLPPTPIAPAVPSSLVVQHEEAQLQYAGGMYHARIRRKLHNSSDAPVTRFLIRISVDRHPGKPETSNELYRQRPLDWDSLELTAHCEDEPMACEVKHDRDAFKEIWLLFENEHGKFPLYPGQTTWIQYSYSVAADKWGQWFQRAIRLPTECLSVQLVFPAALEPAVWAVETSMTAQAIPVRTPISQCDDGDLRIYDWTTEHPDLHARVRFEWRFRGEGAPNDEHVAPSERMRRVGVLQDGDPILRQPCEPFDLPREADVARSVGELLLAYLGPIRAAHSFGKGIGLAAPQIGLSRAAAVVQLPDYPPLVLYNPRIVAASDEHDEQYEGCLSFFDVRGMVRRPLTIDVEHSTLDGNRRITTFERGAARLWAHEVDHLAGILYVDHMPEGAETIPIERYAGTGSDWRY